MENPKTHPYSRLSELSSSNYEIIEGQSDVRSWSVIDENGVKIGVVDDLLFDSLSNKVRYIVVNISDNDYDLEARKILIPIGVAQIHEDEDSVIVPGITINQLITLPDYVPGKVNPGVENLVRHVFTDLENSSNLTDLLTGSSFQPENFYSHRHFDEDYFYQRRRYQEDEDLQTVVATFNDSMEAENAVAELISLGISERNIDLTASDLIEKPLQLPVEDPGLGITNFINSAVNDEGLQEVTSTSSSRGFLLTVKEISWNELGNVISLLDRNGAIEVNETSRDE